MEEAYTYDDIDDDVLLRTQMRWPPSYAAAEVANQPLRMQLVMDRRRRVAPQHHCVQVGRKICPQMLRLALQGRTEPRSSILLVWWLL